MIMVRRIQIGEGELYKRIRLAALRESPSAFSSTYESALNRTSESWSEQADSTASGSDRSTFIAFFNDLPVGIAALYRKTESVELGELLQVWICPEYRSKGIAVQVMDSVFQWAAENGFRTVLANIARGNERAVQFYRKYGFKLADRVSPDAPDVILQKEINADQNS
jgi:GNAT superfamily N-acetyltransferase